MAPGPASASPAAAMHPQKACREGMKLLLRDVHMDKIGKDMGFLGQSFLGSNVFGNPSAHFACILIHVLDLSPVVLTVCLKYFQDLLEPSYG